MKFVKKMLATLVACAMAMTLLTACGGASNGKGNPMLDAVNEILKGGLCNGYDSADRLWRRQQWQGQSDAGRSE